MSKVDTTDLNEQDDGDEAEQRGEKFFNTKREREHFFAQLKVLGIARIVMGFSGSGDDGNWEHPAIYDHADKLLNDRYDDDGKPVNTPPLMLSMPAKFLSFDTRTRGGYYSDLEAKWKLENGVKSMSVDEACTFMFEVIDAKADIDWCNNEGGYGNMVIDVDAGTITFEYHQYERTSNHVADIEVA